MARPWLTRLAAACVLGGPVAVGCALLPREQLRTTLAVVESSAEPVPAPPGEAPLIRERVRLAMTWQEAEPAIRVQLARLGLQPTLREPDRVRYVELLGEESRLEIEARSDGPETSVALTRTADDRGMSVILAARVRSMLRRLASQPKAEPPRSAPLEAPAAPSSSASAGPTPPKPKKRR
jgi:hypothetical protein